MTHNNNSLWCLVRTVTRVFSRRLTLAASFVHMILLPRQIKTLVMSHDDYNDSIIHYAARKKNPNVFGAVMSGIEKDINTQEVWDKRRFANHPS